MTTKIVAPMGLTEPQTQLVETLLSALNHRTGAAAIGAGAGAITGALLPDKGKHRMRRALLGALAGGGLGYGASRLFPAQSQQLNENLVSNLLTKPLGRVLTNTVAPAGYTNKAEELWAGIKKDPKYYWNSIKRDTPTWRTGADYEDVGRKRLAALREVPYRAMFGLPARSWAEPHTQNLDGTYKLSPRAEESLVSSLRDYPEGDNANHLDDGTLGNVLMSPTGKGTLKYRDRWDFDLNPGERPDNVPNILRALVSKITKPVTFSGEIDDPRVIKSGAMDVWDKLVAPAVTSTLAQTPDLVRKGVGRVVTNLVPPIRYSAKEHTSRILSNPVAAVKSVWNDQPLYNKDLDLPGEGFESREFPYRKMFGLQPRFGGVPVQNVDGTYQAEAKTEAAMSSAIPTSPGAYITSVNTPQLGNTSVHPQPDGSYNYRDRWDLDLNPGERANSVTGVLRYLMSKLTTPVTFAGNVKP